MRPNCWPTRPHTPPTFHWRQKTLDWVEVSAAPSRPPASEPWVCSCRTWKYHMTDVPPLITHAVPAHPPKLLPNFSPTTCLAPGPKAADVTAWKWFLKTFICAPTEAGSWALALGSMALRQQSPAGIRCPRCAGWYWPFSDMVLIGKMPFIDANFLAYLQRFQDVVHWPVDGKQL